jgi:hypothetical protein
MRFGKFVAAWNRVNVVQRKAGGTVEFLGSECGAIGITFGCNRIHRDGRTFSQPHFDVGLS